MKVIIDGSSDAFNGPIHGIRISSGDDGTKRVTINVDGITKHTVTLPVTAELRIRNFGSNRDEA